MSPPRADSGPLSDVFKVKITTVIQEQLKPIIAELASQQETLLTHLALLRHNHNVNDYQMTRLENIRNLKQSINFKVTGALGFCPWQRPSMGTNLREPVPADPLKIPQFVPVDSASRAERAATSTALIKEAGVSARRLGVPLTMQDFPRDPVDHKGEDPMHSSVPLFGLGAPRWRTAEGLPDHDEPGTASYDGVLARPQGNRGLQQWDGCAKKKKMKRRPMFKLVEEGKVPYGIGDPPPSSSSIRRAGTSLLEALDVPMQEPRASSLNRSASPSEMTDLRTPPIGATYTRAPSSAPARTGLSRSDSIEAIATMATIGSTATPTSPLPTPPPLRRSGAMAHIGRLPEITDIPTEATLESEFHVVRTTIHRAAAERKEKENKAKDTSESAGDIDVRSTTTTTSSLSRASTMATIGSSPRPTATVSRKATTAKIAKAKSIKSRSKAKVKVKAKPKTQMTRPVGPQRRKRASVTTASASASTSSVSSATVGSSTSTASSITAPSVPKRTLKRARRTADVDEQQREQKGEEEDDDAERPRKRLKRSAAPSPSPSIGRVRGSIVKVEADDGGDRVEHTSSHSQGRGQRRRSTHVTCASAVAGAVAAEAVPALTPARRVQAIKGKKAKN